MNDDQKLKPPPPTIVKTPEEQQHYYYTTLTIKGAHQLRQYLHLNETHYTRIAAVGHSNSRNYYLYAILDEIEKAGMALTNYSEFIINSKKEVTKQDGTDEEIRVTRNIYSMQIDEMSLWMRKLTEILIEVVGFAYTNSDVYYRHYLLIHELSRLRKLQNDFKYYHACDSENIKYQIDETQAEISKMLPCIDPTKCWYIKRSKPGILSTSLSSFEDRLKRLLPRLTASQKLAIGLSYQTYSSISGHIHTDVGDPDFQVGMNQVEANFSNIAMLAGHILLICRNILHKRPKGLLEQLARVMKKNPYPAQLIKQLTKPDIHLGDFVVAYSNIAEVVKINKSPFGYKSYRVKFLGTPPLPTTPEDEFQAKYVKLFEARKKIIKDVTEIIHKTTPDEKINNKQLSNSLRRTVLLMWDKLGIKELAYGNHDLAIKKIEDYLAEKKHL